MTLSHSLETVAECWCNIRENISASVLHRYPHMSSAEPSTCVYVSTSRDHPLHLWDAFTGNLRATYRAYDHLDEVVAANSVCFNNGGNKIFAGQVGHSRKIARFVELVKAVTIRAFIECA